MSPSASTHPIYVVGPATEKSVINLGFPPAKVYGAQCGNGQALAEFILEYYTGQSTAQSTKKLLFLVGETRRDVIPKTLTAAGIGVEEIVIYDTQVMSSFGEHLAEVLQHGETETDDGDGRNTQSRWVVVFSPTGSDTAMEILGRKPHQGSLPKLPVLLKKKTHLATIGPTTASHLRDVLAVEPDVVSAKPSPEGLWDSLEAFEKSMTRISCA